ncbi:MAG: sigma-70 family RNA polymerase sigma factor [Ardenticatenaceae bacterium]|nr:sigma-70 family RNA polymerase sigma factor [Ardenticatenaceae bacterium]MCB9445981.1 sigma-70 family RNA polymerase sigma factor [Ardenticatenaceae bacterium]
MEFVDDLNLVVRAQKGDVDAVGALYDAHHQPIFRYVCSRVGDRLLAEDLTGEIFTRMVTGLPDFTPTAVPFRAWLYRIARHLIIDHHRLENGRIDSALDAIENSDSESDPPGVIVDQQLTQERIRAALARIDSAQQEVVILRFIAGLSLAETAQTLDKTVPAVKSLQHRGLTALRAFLEKV